MIVAAGVLMVLDAGLSMGDTWLSIALGGWILVMALSGALTGPASNRLVAAIEEHGGLYTPDIKPLADRVLLWSRVEAALLVILILDMVAKPG